MRLAIVLVLTLAIFSCGKQDKGTPPLPLPSISLHEAARTGNVGQIRAHIYYKTDLNLLDEKGVTALQYASARGYENVVKLLMNNGAKADAGNGTLADLIEVNASTMDRLKATGQTQLSYPFFKKPISIEEIQVLTSRRLPAIREVLLTHARTMSELSPQDQAAAMRTLLVLLPSRETMQAIYLFLGRNTATPEGLYDPMSESMMRDPRLGEQIRYRYWAAASESNPAMQEYLHACRYRPDLYPLVEIAASIVMPADTNGRSPWSEGAGYEGEAPTTRPHLELPTTRTRP